MGKQYIQHDTESFNTHMEEKAKFWDANYCCLFDDFAIMYFDHMYQCDRAVTALTTWGSTYNYNWSTDGKNQLMIHNMTPKQEAA